MNKIPPIISNEETAFSYLFKMCRWLKETDIREFSSNINGYKIVIKKDEK